MTLGHGLCRRGLYLQTKPAQKAKYMTRQEYLERMDVARYFRSLPGENWNEVFRYRLKAVGLQLTEIAPHKDEKIILQAPDPACLPGSEEQPTPETDPFAWNTPAWIVPDDGLPPVATQIEELRECLWLFREFYNFYVTQTKLGASHHHPLWARIAVALGDVNDKQASEPEYRFIAGPHFKVTNESS